mmetsp:Transcript_3918/g.8075  ORF Transcript_3918/g.8075 Transcript_3918/m.8075 type:complete len:243 (-) Transcript_3918:878-1606(-)
MQHTCQRRCKCSHPCPCAEDLDRCHSAPEAIASRGSASQSPSPASGSRHCEARSQQEGRREARRRACDRQTPRPRHPHHGLDLLSLPALPPRKLSCLAGVPGAPSKPRESLQSARIPARVPLSLPPGPRWQGGARLRVHRSRPPGRGARHRRPGRGAQAPERRAPRAGDGLPSTLPGALAALPLPPAQQWPLSRKAPGVQLRRHWRRPAFSCPAEPRGPLARAPSGAAPCHRSDSLFLHAAG